MNERRKSDGLVVPRKRANNEREHRRRAGQGSLYTGTKVETPDTDKSEATADRVDSRTAERVEGRKPTKGNSVEQNRSRTQRRIDLQHKLDRVRDVARRDKEEKFTALWHHVYDVDRLREAFFAIRRSSAAGVDGVTWSAYGKDLEANLADLSDRLRRGAYRARPVRRVHIPKGSGGTRPIGVPVLEDKIVQRATSEVLNAVYEQDFLGFSYGFRPGRKPHDALDALWVALHARKVSWVLDADIRGFFDAIDHARLLEFIEHRIADVRVHRHIKKWLNAGVFEEGEVRRVKEGTPQGGSVSPLLANIYLHYVLDLWVEDWRRRCARGDVIVVRYADDFVLGFQHRSDAERFLRALKERLAQFALELHPDKTRLIEFGRFAVRTREKRGVGKPETFDFLGFTHYCGWTRNGKFNVKRRTIRERVRAKLRDIKVELTRWMHAPVVETARWLRSVLEGHFRYFGVPGNQPAMKQLRYEVVRLWRRCLQRRSQRTRMAWSRIWTLADRWLPIPRAVHPYPSQRLRVAT